MKTGRDPAVSTPREAAAGGRARGPPADDVSGTGRGATRTRASTPRARGTRGAGTPRVAAGQINRGSSFFPEAAVAAGGGGGPDDTSGTASSRARERRFASNPGPQGVGRAGGQPGERRQYPATPAQKAHRPKSGSRPPARPSAQAGVLPPQHRRPTQAAAGAGGDGAARSPRHSVSISVDSSSSGSTSAPSQTPQTAQQQQERGTGVSVSGSSRRFWFGSSSSSSSRRASFEEAAADFADVGRGGGGGGAKGRDFASAPGVVGAPAGGLSFGGESPAAPRSPGRRWSYLRKGARPPSPPKPSAR